MVDSQTQYTNPHSEGGTIKYGAHMDTSKFVIVGGGMVAGYTAKQLVESGLKPG